MLGEIRCVLSLHPRRLMDLPTAMLRRPQGNLLKLFKTSSMAASDLLVPTMGDVEGRLLFALLCKKLLPPKVDDDESMVSPGSRFSDDV